MHTFSLGPSGAGKSYLSEKLAERESLLWLEADVWPPADGMLHHKLKVEWDRYFVNHDPMPLSHVLDQRATASNKAAVVVSLPGFPILRRRHIEAAHGIFRIVYFTGSPGQCLDAFLGREEATGRGLSIQHWTDNLRGFFDFLKSGEVAANTVTVFDQNGKRSFDDVYRDIQKLGTQPAVSYTHLTLPTILRV